MAQMKNDLAGLNAGIGSNSSAPSSLPSSAPYTAPRPPDPYQGYTPQVSPLGSFTPGTPGTTFAGVPQNNLGARTYIEPGAYAPPAPGSSRSSFSVSGGGGGTGLVPAIGSGVGGSGSVGTMYATVQTMNVIAQNVTIMGQNVVGGAGGNGGNGGQGGTGNSGTQPLPPPSGTGGNAPPPGGGNNPPPSSTPGPSWSGFFQSLQKNPTIGGAYSAILNEMPAGPAAAIGASLYAGNYFIGAEMAGLRPRYETQTQILGAQAGGQYVNPIEATALSKAAETRAQLAKEKAYLAPFDRVLLGLPGMAYDLFRGMELDRQATLEAAHGHADVQRGYLAAMTGRSVSEMPTDDQNPAAIANLGFQTGAARALLPYGTHAARQFAGPMGGTYMEMLRTFGVEGSIGAISAVSQLGQDPTQTGARAALLSGEAIAGTGTQLSNVVQQAARTFAGRGDLAGLAQIMPFFKATGRMGEYNALITQAAPMLDIQNTLGITGSRLGVAQAGFQTLQATGADYGALQENLGVQQGFYQQQIQSLRQLQRAAPTQAEYERYEAQIAGIQAQSAGIPKAQAEIEYGMRGQAIGAAQTVAGVGFQRTLYAGGGEQALSGGFVQRRGATELSAALLREQAGRADIYSPEQRAAYAAQAQQAEYEASVGLRREESSDYFGIAQGRAGLSSATASIAQTRASLFGTATESRGAGLQQAGAIGEQIAAIEAFLKRGNLSLQEQLQYQGQIVSLRRQEVEVTEQAYRGAARQELSVAQGRQGIGQTELGRDYLLGRGGPASYGAASNVANLAGVATQKAQAVVDLLKSRGVSEDNPEMVAARQAVASAQTSQSQAVLGLGQIPQPIAVTQAERRGEFTLGMLSRTYASYGDIRGTVSGLLGNASKQMQNLRDMEAQAEKEGRFNGPEGEALRAEFENRRMEVGNKMIGYQQQLEQGWQDRLISSVVGAPGNFNYVASQFTRREAGQFLGGISPAFGFTNTKDRDYFMFRGPKIANSVIGNISRPEGFGATALSGATDRIDSAPADITTSRMMLEGVPGIPGAPMQRGGQFGGSGEVVFRVIVEDKQGNVLGSTTKTVHDFMNGGFDVSVNRHASGSAHN